MSAPLLPTPWMYGRRRLTRAEIALYVAIVAALIVVFATYMVDYMEMAEKTAMETTINNVTSAINLNYASQYIAGQPVDVRRWMAQNPFELAAVFPTGYLGELRGRNTATLDRPAWLFDAASAELLYLPRLHSHLEAPWNGELRFRLQAHPSGFGFALVPAVPYDWSTIGGFAKNSQVAFRKTRTPLFS